MVVKLLERDEAVNMVRDLLNELDPHTKIEVSRSGWHILLQPRADRKELLKWAKRIGDRYEDVFQRLAES